MAIFLLLIVTLIAFVGYRVHAYKKQRNIEEMAANAQAYVSAEIVELLQKLKKIIINNNNQITPDIQAMQDQLRFLTENMVCHTDSEASVREYLVGAKQDLALLQVKFDKLLKGEALEQPTAEPKYDSVADAFDALK